MSKVASRASKRALDLLSEGFHPRSVQNNIIVELIRLGRFMEEIVMVNMVQVDQDQIDASALAVAELAQRFETAITVVATEINTLLQAAQQQGVTLPTGSLANLQNAIGAGQKALGDLVALETPTTTPVSTTPPADTTPPATDPTPAPVDSTPPVDTTTAPPVDTTTTDTPPATS